MKRESDDADEAAENKTRSRFRRLSSSIWGESFDPPDGRFRLQERVIPLPILFLLTAGVIALAAKGAITPNLPTMIAVLLSGGFICAEIGSILPWLKRAGGPALTAAFLPSYVVSRHWMPKDIVDAITTFTTSTQFIYLFITAIVVGSILSMKRNQLIAGMMKIFVPLVGASVIALVIGTLTGMALRIKPSETFFMVLIPVMAGGVGEGVLPLSTGYAAIRHLNAGVLIARLLPVVLFGNLVSIVSAGILNSLGRRIPHWTGNGALQQETGSKPETADTNLSMQSHQQTIQTVVVASAICMVLYLLGMLFQSLFSFPGPVATLILAVILKLTGILPAHIDNAAGAVGRFFAMAVTYPLLFAVAVAMTPWSAIMDALQPANLILVIVAVTSLIVGGFFIGRLMRLYPIEAALINACHSGSGGTGAVAILTAADRMELMPFAQIATRIGGAITVTLAFLALRWFRVW
jgi:malate:Na+ symporter